MADNKKAAAINAYDVISTPIVTEKTMKLMQEENKYTVKVANDANKIQIKEAFEAIFGVKVLKVNTVNVRAKAKRVGRYTGTVSGYKKAIITLSADENLNVLAENAAQ